MEDSNKPAGFSSSCDLNDLLSVLFCVLLIRTNDPADLTLTFLLQVGDGLTDDRRDDGFSVLLSDAVKQTASV